MSVLGVVDSVLLLAVQVLKLVNTNTARKYYDKLYKLQKKKMELDSLPPEEQDDVEYVKMIKEIELTAQAALNDPAINSTSTSD